MNRPVVVVHGGAGDIATENHPSHLEGCRRAAEAGLERLQSGGSVLDAVQRAVEVLEDDPTFNAGRGATLTSTGDIELDASLMDGASLRAGGVAALPPFRHPIAIARAVLEDGRHVLFAGPGAAEFARTKGFVPVSHADLWTEAAQERLDRFRRTRRDDRSVGNTVGAVACDASGRLAAATSTGGTVGKLPGRIGDSPIVGAGTYADDASGACSATGYGEAILRACLARSACDRILHGATPDAAANLAIAELEARYGGHGGLIVLDPSGRVGIARNTRTMSYAIAREGNSTITGV